VLTLAVLLLLAAAALAAEPPPPAAPLIVEEGLGAVTDREILAFKQFLRTVPLPKDNIRNAIVYGPAGSASEAVGRVFEMSGDVELLDRMIAFADAMLAARNDSQTGIILWTGDRAPVWPNSLAKEGTPAYAGSENGDVVGHIANTARLILLHKPLWEKNVPDGDPHHFGATYQARAETYVREMDRTADVFLLKWFVHPDTQRLYQPASSAYEAAARAGSAGVPVPWNQQAMLNNGFQRLAEAHALLGDAPDRVRQYEAIVQASVDWFFAEVECCEVGGKPCYKWAYLPGEKPIRHYEDTGHGGYDVALLYRAYQSGRYGITKDMLLPFTNTVSCILAQPNHRYVDRVNGIQGSKRPPGGLGSHWIDLCEFDPTLYPDLYAVNKARIKSSPDLTANLWWARQRIHLQKEP
jgi:hypothetical protein